MLHQTEIQFNRSRGSNHIPIIFISFCRLLCFTLLSPSSEVLAWIYHIFSCSCSYAACSLPTIFSIMFFHLLFLYWSFMMLLDTEVKGTVYQESGRRHMHTQALPCILTIWDKCTDFAVGQTFRVWKLHELNKTSSVKDIPFHIEPNQGSASWGEMAALEAQDRALGGLMGFSATGAE